MSKQRGKGARPVAKWINHKNPYEQRFMNQPNLIHRKTACTRDCPDACGLIATIEDDRVVRLQGDPDHPITRGFLCKRTSRYLDRQYHPSRITKPMIRRNKFGGGDWEEVSLDEALNFAAENLLHFRNTHGPASLMNYRCGGSMGIMKYVTDFFFQEFGPVTITSGDICAGAGDAAQLKDFGRVDSHDIFDLLNAKTIFIWGKNVYVSHVHLLPILKQAKANGTKLVLIDPVEHRTAGLCDEYVQVRPGGDGAIAFGIARWLLDQGRLDPEAAVYCDNFSDYCRLVISKSCRQWADLAGISDAELNRLATCYAHGPTATLVGWGMQRRKNGSSIIRTIDALAAVSGNVGISGGGVSFYFPRRSAFDLGFLDDSLAPRKIPEPLLGPGIEAASDPRIEMVWISAANPVATLPESKTLQRALNERFVVVVDCFLTDTAQCADIFLPTTTMLEDDDLIGAYGHHWLNEVRPVIDPPTDVLTDYKILQRLAPRVGVGGWFKDDTDTWKQRLLADLEKQGFGLEHLRQNAPVKNPESQQVLFADRKFPTRSGRINLIKGYHDIGDHNDSDYPMRLMAISTDESQASQWLPETQVGPSPVQVNPKSAEGFSEGEIVLVESELDQLQAQLVFDDNQRTDIALMKKGGWLSAGRCPNVLTRAELTDDGECAVYYDTPVRIRKV